ncbi:MAG: hypothetical protein HFE86_04555 [Clostridiales bacterium]|nr:hypothetical protein [Clostridiales bacterium]
MKQNAHAMQSTKALAAQVGQDRRRLRRAYNRILDGAGGAKEWLRDNFYLLDREAQAALKSLRRMPPMPSADIQVSPLPAAKGRGKANPPQPGEPDLMRRAEEEPEIPDVAFPALTDSVIQPRAYRLCEAAARSAGPAAEALDRILRAFAEKRGGSLYVAEAAALADFMRAAYLRMAAEALHMLSQSGAAPDTIKGAAGGKKKGGSPDRDAAFRMGAAVDGLRGLQSIDFTLFTERYCAVEAVFQSDPGGVYAQMDQASRGYYRDLCARIARKKGMDEMRLAASLRRKAADYGQTGGDDQRMRHIGWWLMEAARPRAAARRRGGILLLTGRYLLPALAGGGLAYFLRLWWLFPALLLPMVEIFRPFFDWLSGRLSRPAFLPRLELETGIPEEGACLVVVSQLVPPADKAEALTGRLLQLARTNAPKGEENCKICLLADLKQAVRPNRPGDEEAVAALRRVVRRLNKTEGDRFILAVRGRTLIKTQRAYAGWERKRGAITQLCRFCRGEAGDFLALEGDVSFLRSAKYMLALDADTEPQLDTARRMVAAALHPLNRPVIDRRRGVVVEGYGILAPRVGTTLRSAGATPFSRIMSGAGGVTAYDTLSGDFYQDYFGRSIFAGKGLIDLGAFQACMDAFLPDERVLSHDILEGSVLRCGYLSDVEVSDGCPSGALSYLSRLHRWIRGDWQNLPWLFGRIPAGEGAGRKKDFDSPAASRSGPGPSYLPARADAELGREAALSFDRPMYKAHPVRRRKTVNPLPGLCRYMLFDNLRRSVTPVLAAVCLALGFAAPSAAGWLAAAALLSQAAPGIFSALFQITAVGVPALSRRYYSRATPAALTALCQALMNCLLLFQTAWVSLQAAALGVWRQYVSRKNLLEWVTAADSERGQGVWAAARRCWPSFAAGLLLFFLTDSLTRLTACFFLLTPLAVCLTGRAGGQRPPRLSESQREKLAGQAAATWRFYEELAVKSDNWLPPDNIQEAPVYALAHRTSPTNMGLCFLSTLAARDMGFIDTAEMCKRLSGGIASAERMEKWEGNLLNWYDTRTLEPLFPRYVSTVDSGNFICCLCALWEGLRDYEREEDGVAALRGRIKKLIDETRLAPLYDSHRKLFRIGIDLETGRPSDAYYDLLMSESRAASYFAVATRQVDRRHWGALGRTLAKEDGYAGPVSWSGTMFEYFMPHILLPAPTGSLSYEALRFCMHCQKKRAKALGRPFGCSESGFYAFDPQLNYQYKAHGVQRLGLRRRLNSEYVVAPYATFLTLPLLPQTGLRNLERLEKLGLTGRYGFYEAVDFTKERAGAAGFSIVRSYMAHHVGMSFLSVFNLLEDNKMQKRFMAAGDLSAAAELLEEKLPEAAPVFDDLIHRQVPEKPGRTAAEAEEFDLITPRHPRVHLLSNGEWTVAAADCGATLSACQGADMLRRSEDLLRRPLGLFAVVEPLTGGKGGKRGGGKAKAACPPFSITAAPAYEDNPDGETSAGPVRRVVFGDSYAAYFTETDGIEAGMRIQVHETQPCEIRRFALRSKNGCKQTVRLLLYAEPSLARPEDAEAHPAFSRLFLRGQYISDHNAILFTRRPREGEQGSLCLAMGFAEELPFAYDFDREHILRRPDGIASLLRPGVSLEKRAGVPDPCAALSLELELPAKGQRMATLLMTLGRTREEALDRLLDCRRQLRPAPAPLFDGSLEARLCQVILPELLYPGRDSKARLAAARENDRGMDALWSFGISGDLPILAMAVKNAADAGRAEPYIRLHRRLRRYGVAFDLVFLYRQGGAYDRPVEEALRELIRAVGQENLIGQKGGLHLADQTRDPDNAVALLAAARYIVPDTPTQISPLAPPYTPVPFLPVQPPAGEPAAAGAKTVQKVSGGIFLDDRFVITRRPALPWCHVLAGEGFGTLVSDSALGFTWAENCRENKLTPWYNDTAADNRGELLLLRVGGKIYDLIRGSRVTYTPDCALYEGEAAGIRTAVRVEVIGAAKRVTLELERGDYVNPHDIPLEIAYYTEPVLGVSRAWSRQISAKWDKGGLYLHNPFQKAVPGGMLLTACAPSAEDGPSQPAAGGCVCDRGAFLSGRWAEHNLAPLPDPCAAVVVRRELPARRRDSIRFILSFGRDEPAARAAADAALPSGPAPSLPPAGWGLTVQTGDSGLDALVNTWLPVQIQQSRINGRTGFYQCGGAYGFRDQLQDVCAQMYWNPEAARRHILRAAAHQFEEGDALHWWHPLPPLSPNDPPYARDAGVRTRMSDDMLWLPYAVCHYLRLTGDWEILSQSVPYLSAPPLSAKERERYFTPTAGPAASLYDHCLRALSTLRTGKRGLPLMGTGDWNDGLSKVGEGGKGESVWLAQFAAMVCRDMAWVCRKQGDAQTADRLTGQAAALLGAVDKAAWAGEWYLRAFMDDGRPLGGPRNSEMRIDLLPQAFSVLSGMPDAERRRSSLDAALRLLVDKRAGIVKLFAPPFDKEDPGYIRGYPPGVRENGGQYTHGAVWLIRALFQEGRAEEAYDLFRMISPVTRSLTPPAAAVYKAEPYALAADVYASPDAGGRAGWTLYTGSAGWYYRTAVENLLGLHIDGDRLILSPCLPAALPGYRATLRHKGAVLSIQVERPAEGDQGEDLLVDGRPADFVPLDGKDHQARLILPC